MLLRGGHFFGLGRSEVIKAGEVQKTVDDIESEFLSRAVAKLWSACGSNGRADENLAIGKRDDIRCPRDMKKFTVHFCHGAGTEDANLKSRQRSQLGLVFYCQGETTRKG